MVIAGKIKINTSINGGEVSGSDNDDKVLAELKKISSQLLKSAKLDSAGLGGAGSGLLRGGGALSKLLNGTVLGGAASIAGGVALGQGITKTLLPVYNKAIVDGEKMVIGMNRTTGEVTEMITEREAIEEGILDATGQIKAKYDVQGDIFDNMTKDLAHQKDYVMLTAKDMEGITTETTKQKKLQQDITSLLREIKNKHLKELNKPLDIDTGMSQGIEVVSNDFQIQQTAFTDWVDYNYMSGPTSSLSTYSAGRNNNTSGGD